MIPQNLIENALALTGKTMEDMKIFNPSMELEVSYQFYFPNFFSYLLSPEFIEKNPMCYSVGKKHFYISDIGIAIHEYQKGEYLFGKGEITEKQKDEYKAPIISLLEKIGPIQTYNSKL